MLGNVRYITITELDDNSGSAEVIALGDDGKNKLIIQAQLLIDSYLWFINGRSVNDDTLFPIYDEDDNEVEIPSDIKLATVYIVDWIHTLWGINSVGEVGSVVSETTGPHTEVFHKDYLASLLANWLPNHVGRILEKYKLTLASTVI